MDFAVFWQLIMDTKRRSQGDCTRQATLLVQSLIDLNTSEIMGYYRVFEELLDRARTYELWNAVIVIDCGCSESRFEEFRAWLISQGEDIYKAVMDDPEYLVNVVEFETKIYCEDMLYVATRAYETLMDEEIPVDIPRVNTGLKGSETITSLEDRDHILRQQFPQLYEKFGNCERWNY